ncbi:hATC-domain-containing protein [Wolfiporia cocos MD-104 SS10]|uniref:HATC-domain-containing protein n=1 Tax=Wolfiporia cocos (strain MD-104) TaxID=742152 RepID=A0A2H3J0V2_WOLCO|nr:hATC-domain-containing protein [Wolfiporia cocos MD-104 SS10]
MAQQPKFSPVLKGLHAGLAKIHKWYQATGQTDIYFVCLALDPSIKLEYIKRNWDQQRYNSGKSALDAVVIGFLVCQSRAQPDIDILPLRDKGYAGSWIRNSICSRLENEGKTRDPHRELRDYLNSPLEDVDDPIKWWGYHATQYPVLSRIARDYLSIQGSSVSSERAFSSGGRTGTKLRNRLTPETFEALQILKGSYHSGCIGARNNIDS